MGLDIFAASNLRYVRPIPDDEELDRLEEEINRQDKDLEDVYFRLSPNDMGWESHLSGMEPGLYEYTAATVQHDFRVGSYSTYSWWREQLDGFTLQIKPNAIDENLNQTCGEPFIELIEFTDCDGRIGTRVASKLAADFRSFISLAEKYAASLDEGEFFLSIYKEFALAFELAAQQGALKFC